MIKVEKIEVFGWNRALTGMRNPLNSWDRSDSTFHNGEVEIGKNDLDLMQRLFKGGAVHRKYLRMIHVQMDITAPLYWWKEFDTYKVGTTANSCSTMHKIHTKEFTVEDFSTEHLTIQSLDFMEEVVEALNIYRTEFITTQDKKWWWQMIQMLPSSYNQKRTIDCNYEVIYNMLGWRQDHKLDEWREFCQILLHLPYVRLIMEGAKNEK